MNANTPQCAPGNKLCGKRCVPQKWKCAGESAQSDEYIASLPEVKIKAEPSVVESSSESARSAVKELSSLPKYKQRQIGKFAIESAVGSLDKDALENALLAAGVDRRNRDAIAQASKDTICGVAALIVHNMVKPKSQNRHKVYIRAIAKNMDLDGRLTRTVSFAEGADTSVDEEAEAELEPQIAAIPFDFDALDSALLNTDTADLAQIKELLDSLFEDKNFEQVINSKSADLKTQSDFSFAEVEETDNKVGKHVDEGVDENIEQTKFSAKSTQSLINASLGAEDFINSQKDLQEIEVPEISVDETIDDVSFAGKLQQLLAQIQMYQQQNITQN